MVSYIRNRNGSYRRAGSQSGGAYSPTGKSFSVSSGSSTTNVTSRSSGGASYQVTTPTGVVTAGSVEELVAKTGSQVIYPKGDLAQPTLSKAAAGLSARSDGQPSPTTFSGSVAPSAGPSLSRNVVSNVGTGGKAFAVPVGERQGLYAELTPSGSQRRVSPIVVERNMMGFNSVVDRGSGLQARLSPEAQKSLEPKVEPRVVVSQKYTGSGVKGRFGGGEVRQASPESVIGLRKSQGQFSKENIERERERGYAGLRVPGWFEMNPAERTANIIGMGVLGGSLTYGGVAAAPVVRAGALRLAASRPELYAGAVNFIEGTAKAAGIAYVGRAALNFGLSRGLTPAERLEYKTYGRDAIRAGFESRSERLGGVKVPLLGTLPTPKRILYELPGGPLLFKEIIDRRAVSDYLRERGVSGRVSDVAERSAIYRQPVDIAAAGYASFKSEFLGFPAAVTRTNLMRGSSFSLKEGSKVLARLSGKRSAFLGVGEGVSTLVAANIGRERRTTPGGLLAAGAFGGLTAGAFGYGIGRFSVSKPLVSRGILGAGYVTDPYEVVGDVAESVVRRTKKLVSGVDVPGPVVVRRGDVLSFGGVPRARSSVPSIAFGSPVSSYSFSVSDVPSVVGGVTSTNVLTGVPTTTRIGSVNNAFSNVMSDSFSRTLTNVPSNVPTNIPTDIPTELPTQVPTMINVPTFVTAVTPKNIPPFLPPIGGGGGFGGVGGKAVKRRFYVNELAAANNLLADAFGGGFSPVAQRVSKRRVKRRKDDSLFSVSRLRLPKAVGNLRLPRALL